MGRRRIGVIGCTSRASEPDARALVAGHEEGVVAVGCTGDLPGRDRGGVRLTYLAEPEEGHVGLGLELEHRLVEVRPDGGRRWNGCGPRRFDARRHLLRLGRGLDNTGIDGLGHRRVGGRAERRPRRLVPSGACCEPQRHRGQGGEALEWVPGYSAPRHRHTLPQPEDPEITNSTTGRRTAKRCLGASPP